MLLEARLQGLSLSSRRPALEEMVPWKCSVQRAVCSATDWRWGKPWWKHAQEDRVQVNQAGQATSHLQTHEMMGKDLQAGRSPLPSKRSTFFFRKETERIENRKLPSRTNSSATPAGDATAAGYRGTRAVYYFYGICASGYLHQTTRWGACSQGAAVCVPQ